MLCLTLALTLALLEAIGSGNRAPDPQAIPGHFMYSIKSTYSQGERVLEVLVDESTGQINHVLHKRLRP